MITTKQHKFNENKQWVDIDNKQLSGEPQLVLAFGGRELVEDESVYTHIKEQYPQADIVSVSTAGEILDNTVSDNTVSVTAVHFEKTKIKTLTIEIPDTPEEPDCEHILSQKIPELISDDLRHILVFSDGLNVNGSKLASVLAKVLPNNVTVTGGLSGDGAKFKATAVGLNDVAKSRQIVVIGLYGDALSIGYGSLGGWDSFGITKTITKSEGNVLYELDGEPALDVYKRYLGDKASELPSSGLLFPVELCMECKNGTDDVKLVRTLLAIDEESKSITFAGDMPEGIPARLMKANFDRLIDGADGAAKQSRTMLGDTDAQLAILVSCVGRKLVLKERIEDEIDAVKSVVGDNTAITGFYSYGEICPSMDSDGKSGAVCQLHNQTMTITMLSEV